MSTSGTEIAQVPTRCDECGSPAAADQRYCLHCGAHITDVTDPVAVYLSEASAARKRVAAAVARGAVVKRRRIPKVSGAYAVVFVVIALLVGIAIGHSSSNGSARSGPTAKVTTKSGSGSESNSKATKVVKSTGKSYRQEENNLPTSVTP